MLTICSVIFIIAIILWYIQYFKWSVRVKGIRGPTPIPILGNILEIKGRKTFLKDISSLFTIYGKNVKFMRGVQPTILVADYDVMEKILRSSKILDKSPSYALLSKWLKLGLLLNTGDKWKVRRRMLTPAYHFSILKQFIPIFDRHTDNLINQIRKNDNLEAIDIHPYITLAALDIICETAMGVDVNAQLTGQSEYVACVKSMTKIFRERSIRPWEMNNWIYKFSNNYNIEQKCLTVLHGFTKSVIAKRRHELHFNANNIIVHDDLFAEKQGNFLDLLLQLSGNDVPLSDEDIQEEVDTFMFEGHDTTASCICFAIYSIANNSHVQDKIVAEQEEIFGSNQRKVTYDDLKQMRYLELVIKETLRLYPSVPFYGRYTAEDLEIGNGIMIPAGTSITLAAYEIHRDPKYFPDPNRFDPDRFLPHNDNREHPYSYIPFSAGPRNCIGQKFAILEMKAQISKIIRNFKVTPTIPAHKLELVADITLKSDNGVFVKFNKR